MIFQRVRQQARVAACLLCMLITSMQTAYGALLPSPATASPTLTSALPSAPAAASAASAAQAVPWAPGPGAAGLPVAPPGLITLRSIQQLPAPPPTGPRSRGPDRSLAAATGPGPAKYLSALSVLRSRLGPAAEAGLPSGGAGAAPTSAQSTAATTALTIAPATSPEVAPATTQAAVPLTTTGATKGNPRAGPTGPRSQFPSLGANFDLRVMNARLQKVVKMCRWVALEAEPALCL
jgi:hypothetical protein